MAVRIPQYTEQVRTPGSVVSGAEGSVPRAVNLDLSGFDQFRHQMQAKREEADLNNARAEIAAEEPRAQLAMASAFSDLQRTWTPGSRPMAEQMFDVIDTYRRDAETRITNPKARELFAERANEFKTHFGLQGFAFQQKAELDNRVTTYENGYADAANAASLNPAEFPRMIATLNASVMADTQMPEAAKAEFVRKQSAAAALSVAKAQADLNPELAASLTGSLLGITEPTIPAGSPAAGDIRGEIIKRESGGRMYGADGNVLRGPAIQTKDGATIHAYGPYQLLESTARDQAKAAGVPWDRDLFFRARTGDPVQDAKVREYHDLLGQAYIQTQDALFGGNPVLIAAAHNMGPEATKGWAAGRPYQTQSGKWWYPSKPMDMTAMPEETRKYVQGLGAVETPIAQTAGVRTDGEDATAYRLLDADQLLAVRGIAMSNLAERRRQESEALKVQGELFKQRIDDIEVAAKKGDPFEIPSDTELVTFLGPAQAALTKQRLANYQGMAAGLKQMPALSNDELSAIASAPDPEGTEDRENRQFVRDSMAEEAGRILAARQADPGQASLTSSNVVQDSYRAWGDAANAFYGAGAQATPEQFDAMARAQQTFVRTSFAQQRAWGITQPKLPKGVTEKMAEGFRVQMERDPAQAAAYLSRLPDLLGSDEAVAEVGNKIGALAWLAMDGVPGLTLAKLQTANATPIAKRMELLPDGTNKADVERAVRQSFDPLLSTLAYQNDTVTANRYREAGMALTIDRMSRGASLGEAAASAYAELFGDRNTVNGSYRIDTTRYNADTVTRGLDMAMANLAPESLLVQPEPGFSLAESQARKARIVQQVGYWVNNGAGTGVYLMHPNGPVMGADGKPIQVLFDDAARAKPAPVQETNWRMGYGSAKGL